MTLRRHAASLHLQHYRKWCDQNKFDSMLPEDAKECKQAAIDKNIQSMVTDHFKPETEEDKPIFYSDKGFASAAVEWLVDADLPLQVFSRPSFKRMIDIASRANCGVKLPSMKQTRGHIIKTFKQQMFMLKERLNVHYISIPSFCANDDLESCRDQRGQLDMRHVASC
ncbi:hypothetical protein EI94DRAFT_1595605 [Lactarius quietus]|nr:hypothetical protein EI94DRAFT_1595605 [Lactarius quietus]